MDEEVAQDLDAPTSAPAKVAAAGGSVAANTAGAGSDSEDDAAPDYGPLAALAKKANAARHGFEAPVESSKDSSGEKKGAAATPFIPKRGEKDFEPTGFAGQNKALEASRKAMFDVIKCERVVNSKSVSIATWESSLNRAFVQLARGQTFASMGYAHRVQVLQDGQYADLAQLHCPPSKVLAEPAGTSRDGVWWPKMQSRIELFPEEALYLVERGSLECRVPSRTTMDSKSSLTLQNADSFNLRDYGDATRDTSWVPMSVEQAYASMLYRDGLTRERYQLYAYLKRLGYIVQRKSATDALRKTALHKQSEAKSSQQGTADEENIGTEGVIADPQHPLRLVTIVDLLLYPIRRVVQLGLVGVSRVHRLVVAMARWLRSLAAQRFGSVWLPQYDSSHQRQGGSSSCGRGLLGIGDSQTMSFDDVFTRLRIVPSGHNASLPRPHNRKASQDAVPEIFFYAWRPATHFKKTDPPLPEFQLATVDARASDLPSAYAFADLFETLPRPLSSDDVAHMSEEERRVWERAQEEKRRNDESYGRGAVRKMKATKAAETAAAAAQADAAARQRRSANSTLASALHSDSVRRIAHLLKGPFQRILSLLTYLSRFFAHLPPGCAVSAKRGHYAKVSRSQRHNGAGINGSRPVNVYGPLKAGRRNVIVAVNDCGTTSLLRFGEAEFARWRLAGSDAQP